MKKFVARAIIGQEFIYVRSSAHAVPAASAYKIRDALNAARFRLNDGETWHVYDAEGEECWQRFYIRSGKIFES